MEDMVAFNQYYFENSSCLRRQRIIAIAIFSTIYLGIGVVQTLVRDSVIPLLVWMVVAVVFSLWYYRASKKVNPKRIARLYSEEKNKGTFCEHKLKILPEGIRETTDVGEQMITFAGIERIETTDTHAFIFIGTMQAHVIPRNRVLEGDLDEFISVLMREMAASSEANQHSNSPLV
jgi:hypothetical protein